jgi:hypothetical protein
VGPVSSVSGTQSKESGFAHLADDGTDHCEISRRFDMVKSSGEGEGDGDEVTDYTRLGDGKTGEIASQRKRTRALNDVAVSPSRPHRPNPSCCIIFT